MYQLLEVWGNPDLKYFVFEALHSASIISADTTVQHINTNSQMM